SLFVFFFSSRRRHTRSKRDWSSDVCSSDLAFVSNDFDTLNDLPQGARLGTSSLRRQSQMQALRPDLEIISLRGNVQTRLGRLDEIGRACVGKEWRSRRWQDVKKK